jgi:hypothetical protein
MDANDIPLSNCPAKSCCNCGFLSKFVFDKDGNNERWDVQVVPIERARGFLENGPAFGGKRMAIPVCWMRQGVLEAEHDESLRALRNDRMEADKEVIHRDRSEEEEAFCPQYATWVPHLTFREHWEERKVIRLERERRAWEKAQQWRMNIPQVVIAVVSLLALVVGGIGLLQGSGDTIYNGVTPTAATASITPTPLLTPDTASPLSTPTS